jgi:hypothetical protein
MKRWTKTTRLVLFGVLLGLLAASPALAQVHLSFTPADTVVAPGQPGRLSIMVSDTIEIRTIDVTVTYDTTVVRSLGGAKGALYTDSGVSTFAGFEEDTLGTWHGYAVLLGSGLFVEGPGELYYWDFEGLVGGTTPIISVSVFVSTTDGSWFPDVSLPPTTVIVDDPLSAVEVVPHLNQPLKLWPNPFNPRTEVRFELMQDSWAHLAVYDARGRQVTVLRDGFSSAGPLVDRWDGRDAAGRNQPGGVYLFRLRTNEGVAITKGTLLK